MTHLLKVILKVHQGKPLNPVLIFFFYKKPIYKGMYVLNGQYQNRIPTKIKWKIDTFFTLYFKFWRYINILLTKNCKMQPPDILFLFVLLAFTLAGIIFHKKLQSKISEKIFSSQIFLFNGFAQTPYPLNGQNLLSVTKVFCWCFLRN